jgi:hypothetical protein
MITILTILAGLGIVAGMTLAVESQGPNTQGQQARTYQAAAAAQKRGIFVVQGADDVHVAAASVANSDCLGVQEEDSINANDPVRIIKGGEAVCIIGAAISSGVYAKVDASGRLIPTTAAGDYIVAKAITSGVNAGDFIIADVVRFIR